MGHYSLVSNKFWQVSKKCKYPSKSSHVSLKISSLWLIEDRHYFSKLKIFVIYPGYGYTIDNGGHCEASEEVHTYSSTQDISKHMKEIANELILEEEPDINVSFMFWNTLMFEKLVIVKIQKKAYTVTWNLDFRKCYIYVKKLMSNYEIY